MHLVCNTLNKSTITHSLLPLSYVPSSMMAFNWLEEELPVGQRAQARGFSAQSAGHREKRTCTTCTKKSLFQLRTKQTPSSDNGKIKSTEHLHCGIFKSPFDILFSHLSINYSPCSGATAVRNLQIKPQTWMAYRGIVRITSLQVIQQKRMLAGRPSRGLILHESQIMACL